MQIWYRIVKNSIYESKFSCKIQKLYRFEPFELLWIKNIGITWKNSHCGKVKLFEKLNFYRLIEYCRLTTYKRRSFFEKLVEIGIIHAFLFLVGAKKWVSPFSFTYIQLQLLMLSEVLLRKSFLIIEKIDKSTENSFFVILNSLCSCKTESIGFILHISNSIS